MNPPAERTCPCGHTRRHPLVIAEPQYSLWGWIMLTLIGITPVAERVVFRCSRCRRTLGSSRDPKLLGQKKLGAPVSGTDAADVPPKSASEPQPADPDRS